MARTLSSTTSSSWALFRQSWNVLREDKHLVIFPVLSTIAGLLVLASFAVPAALLVPWAELSSGEDGARQIMRTPWWYAGLFAFYFANFFVVTFFNSALVSCAAARFAGRDCSAGAGLRAAAARLPQILAWAAVAATVGVVLKAIQERAGFVGRIVIGLIGMAWAIATYFVVPVLVLEGLGPIDSIKRSVSILRQTWGESLVLRLGMGLAGFLLTLAALTPAIVGGALSVALQNIVPIVVGGAASVLLLFVLALVTSTLKVIIQTAIYRFAATGAAPAGFDAALLQGAIRPK